MAMSRDVTELGNCKRKIKKEEEIEFKRITIECHIKCEIKIYFYEIIKDTFSCPQTSPVCKHS